MMLRVGDKVKLKRGVNFRWGQGGVSFEEIGIINLIDTSDNSLRISFPSHSCWLGMEGEVIKVEREVNDMELVCRDCGEKINRDNDYHEIGEEFICEHCFEENYSYCDDCGEVINRDDGYYVESEDRFVCQECLDNNYEQCEDCGEYFQCGDLRDINDGDYRICERCRDNGNYFECERCGNDYDTDRMNERNGSYCCDDCYEEMGGELYDYHEFDDWEFFKGKNEEKPPYYIGAEIELEPKGHSNVSKVINIIDNHINAVGMHDGSLRDGGVEVVTHPESWEYKLEHEEDYVKFFQEIKEINYGDAGGTGLHFHVSRPNDNVVARVMVLLESFKDEIKKLSRRNGDFHWSQFLSDMTDDKKEKTKYQSTKYLKDEYINEWHDRYFALNLRNEHTIEFRFFKGANDFEEFWGALQFIHNIMELALNEERELNTINWKELITGYEITEQAKKLGVYEIDKFAKDTTEMIERIFEEEEKAKKEIKRILNNLIKYVNKEMTELDIKSIKASKIDEIYEKSDDFLTQYKYRMQYLSNIIFLYHEIDDREINSIEQKFDSIKSQYPVNTKRYARYGKQIEKAFKNYKEVE